jgi:methionyl-tRNA synthetase
MDDAVELLPADYWRWFLMANAPETSDSTFTWELFASAVNKDLADTFGNFVNRSLRFAASRFGDEVPAGGEAGEAEAWLVDELGSAVVRYSEYLGGMQFRKAATELRAIWALGNAYLDRTAPWQAVRDDPAQAAGTMRVGINLIRIFAVLAAPIIPATSTTVLAALGRPDDDRAWISSDIRAELEVLTPGQRFEVPPVLFRKVTEEEIAEWTARFGGEAETEG